MLNTARQVTLDEKDILLFPDKPDFNPLIVWCLTNKVKRSLTLKGKHKVLIVLNLKDLFAPKFIKQPADIWFLGTILFLEYALVHELCHWAIDKTEILEKTWDTVLREEILRVTHQ